MTKVQYPVDQKILESIYPGKRAKTSQRAKNGLVRTYQYAESVVLISSKKGEILLKTFLANAKFTFKYELRMQEMEKHLVCIITQS